MMSISSTLFVNRIFPSSEEVASYKEWAVGTDRFNRIRESIIRGSESGLYSNPFSSDSREYVMNKSVKLEVELSIPRDAISKIYWGILCPKISKNPFDEAMRARIQSIWKKTRTVDGIVKNLYDLNNSRSAKNISRPFYETKNTYTPPHVIQQFLEEEGLAIWSQPEEDQLIDTVLWYDDAYPNLSFRKGVRSLADFEFIRQMPYLQGITKTPEQMMDQWNQRSSLWLIGQQIRPEDVSLLEELYLLSYSSNDLSEKFAAAKGGMYYPDCVMEEFYDKKMLLDFPKHPIQEVLSGDLCTPEGYLIHTVFEDKVDFSS